MPSLLVFVAIAHGDPAPPPSTPDDDGRKLFGGCVIDPAVARTLPGGVPWDQALRDYRVARAEVYGATALPVAPRLVAEFEPAQDLHISWDPAYAATLGPLVAAATRGGTVVVHVDPAQPTGGILSLLRAHQATLARVLFLPTIATDSVWMRDYGPFGLADGTLVDAHYTLDCVHDDAFPTRLAQLEGRAVARTALHLDGGDLVTDGRGACLVSEAVLARNDLDALAGHAALFGLFGCDRTVWLRPLAGEAADHVDMFAQFAPGGLLLAQADPAVDAPNAAVLDDNRDRVLAVLPELAVTRLPTPPPLHVDGATIPRSYANFTVFNDVVLVPSYRDDPTGGEQARAVIGAAFPGRAVVAVPSDVLAPMLGAVHCVTRTLPAP